MNRPDLDLRDAHVYGGLALATVGGLMISWPVTVCALGIVLLTMGIFAPRAARGASPDGDPGASMVSTEDPAIAARRLTEQLERARVAERGASWPPT